MSNEIAMSNKIIIALAEIIECRDSEIAQDLGHLEGDIGDVEFPLDVVRKIFNKLKEIGLYKLDDLEIDRDEVETLLFKFQCDGAYAHRNNPKGLAKAIANANPICVKK